MMRAMSSVVGARVVGSSSARVEVLRGRGPLEGGISRGGRRRWWWRRWPCLPSSLPSPP